MSTGYSRAPKLIKGALIEFSERFLVPVPNVIIFQYNPETMTRTLEVWNPGGEGGASADNNTSHTAQPFDPPETFSLVLELDAADALEKPQFHPVAFISGVADRIAAMEMLLYPQVENAVSGLMSAASGALSVGAGAAGAAVSGAIGAAIGSIGALSVPRGTVPVVLFAWGPGRILPVRVTSFSVEEQAYSPLLYPIRAKVTIGLKILTPRDFPNCKKKISEEIAIAAFKYTRKQKEILAASNLVNDIESIIAPFL